MRWCACHFSSKSSCQMVTDFLPSRSPALPFHTANATGTRSPGRELDRVAPSRERAREQHAVRAGRVLAVSRRPSAPRADARASVPKPCAVRSSAALRRVGSATMLPAPQAVTNVGSDCSVERVARRLLDRRLEQVRIRVDADVRVHLVDVLEDRLQVRLPLRLPHPDVDGRARLAHREERRVRREGELDGRGVAEVLRPDRGLVVRAVLPLEEQREAPAVVHGAHRDLLGAIGPPPERHQVEVDRRRVAPDAGVGARRQRGHAAGHDPELLHLDLRPLRIARERPHEVDEMPGVLAVQIPALRHRRSGQAGDDAAVDLSGSGLPLKTPSVRSRGRVGKPFESVCFCAPSPARSRRGTARSLSRTTPPRARLPPRRRRAAPAAPSRMPAPPLPNVSGS